MTGHQGYVVLIRPAVFYRLLCYPLFVTRLHQLKVSVVFYSQLHMIQASLFQRMQVRKIPIGCFQF